MKSKLEEIIGDYERRFTVCNHDEFQLFRSLSNFSTVLKYAAFAMTKEGQRFPHQRRIKKIPMQRALQIFLANADAIRSVKDFDELHELIYQLTRQIEGLGELYVYDTALRISAHLNKMPTKVYLHAGTRIGAAALGLNDKAKTLEVIEFPKELQRLDAHEIEDVLCIYKDKLGRPENGDSDMLDIMGCN